MILVVKCGVFEIFLHIYIKRPEFKSILNVDYLKCIFGFLFMLSTLALFIEAILA